MNAPAEPTQVQKLGAEFLGTLWLVLGGCGTAVFATGAFGEGNTVLILGVALAFGLTVVTGAYAFGPISGGHFNPAVSLGMASAGRFAWKDVPAYVVSQILGGTVGALIIFVIAKGNDLFTSDMQKGFATNGYGDRSPGGFNLASVLITEVVLTAVFVLIIALVTARRATPGMAGLAIGLSLTLIHLISIPISNTSVNPARSLAVAFFAGGDALSQVWLFIVAPLVGAAIAGFAANALFPEEQLPDMEDAY